MLLGLFFLLVLASYRITRVVTRDKLPLVHLPREAFVQRWGTYEDAEDKAVSISGRRTNLFMRSLAYLWECDWCTGVWVAAGTVYVSTLFVSVPYPYLQGLAVAACVGLLAERETP